MKIAFVLDPLPSLQPHHDTSLALMAACERRGHQVYALTLPNLWVQDGQAWARVDHLSLDLTGDPWFTFLSSEALPLGRMDAVWMRKDPPVDNAYITATQLLDLIPAPTLVLNHPAGLRSANEKLFALQFQDWIPTTLVSQNKAILLDFVQERGQAVLKPLGGKGGEGILFLTATDRNLKSLVEISTQFGQVPVMVQEYLPAAKEGDKRILLLDGQPLGAVNRIPGDGDFRGNIAAGGRVAATTITPREQDLCAALAPVLQRDKLYFVGIDVIGEKLTEINVTSPTMLQEMSQLTGLDLATQVVTWLENKCYKATP
ncbi:MAG: glutathione synthase [Synechococcales cyanobacterium]